MTAMAEHAKIVQPFRAGLRGATGGVAQLNAEDITAEAALYGMMGILTERGLARDFATQYINELYQIR
jgi:hypothetical protein